MFKWFRKAKKASSQRAAQRAITDVPIEELRGRELGLREQLADHSREINHLSEREARLMEHGKSALDDSQMKTIAYEIKDIRKAKARLDRRFQYLARKLEVASQMIAIREDEQFYRANGLHDLLGATDADQLEHTLEKYVEGVALTSEEEEEGMDRVLRRVREYDLSGPALASTDADVADILSEMKGEEKTKQPQAQLKAAQPEAEYEIAVETPALETKPSSDAPAVGEDTATFERKLRELE